MIETRRRKGLLQATSNFDTSWVRKVEPKITFVRVRNAFSSISPRERVKDKNSSGRVIKKKSDSIAISDKATDTFMKDQNTTSKAVHDVHDDTSECLGHQVRKELADEASSQHSKQSDDIFSLKSLMEDKYEIDKRKELEEQLQLQSKLHVAEAKFQQLDIFFNEERDPDGWTMLSGSTDVTDDLRDDDTLDKIETEQNLHEPNEHLDDIGNSDVDDSQNTSALAFAKKESIENEAIKKLLSYPITKFDSTVLLLASTLVSNNRYIVELMKENALLTLPVQKVALSLANKVVSRSKSLCDALLSAERSAEETTKKLVISCLNDIVSGSNQLSRLIKQGCNPEAIATDTAVNELTTLPEYAPAKNGKPLVSPTFTYDVVSKEEFEVSTALYEYFRKTTSCEPRTSSSIINDILCKRDQISRALYESFQRAVQNNNIPSSSTVAQYITDELKKIIDFLTDPDKLSSFICTGATGLAETKNGARKKPSSPDITMDETMDETTTDASSFLNFIDSSGLSMIFSEDEEGIEVGKSGRVIEGNNSARINLDMIFRRINVKQSRKNYSNDDSRWGLSRKKKQDTAKVSRKEKRKQLLKGRISSRSDEKEKKKDRMSSGCPVERNIVRGRSTLGEF
eukprot:jgi/Psemu1/38209/gm1.38209_g